MKRAYLFLVIFVLAFPIVAQERLRFGHIPWGISIEQAIERFGPIYDVYREETGTRAFNADFIDFTALRPMFTNVFGEITPSRVSRTSAWRSFDSSFTRILRLGETRTIPQRTGVRTYTEWTVLYFKYINGQSRLFMVARKHIS